MIDEKRKAYNKARYEQQRQQREWLAEFKAKYPERYAELLMRAQTEIESPAPKASTCGMTLPRVEASPMVNAPKILMYKTTAYGQVLRTWPLSIEELDSILYDPQKRHVYVTSKDAWGKEHLTCESIPYPTDSVTQAVEIAITKRWQGYTVLTYELCNCSACLKRHKGSVEVCS
jgi:hypothetical protein